MKNSLLVFAILLVNSLFSQRNIRVCLYDQRDKEIITAKLIAATDSGITVIKKRDTIQFAFSKFSRLEEEQPITDQIWWIFPAIAISEVVYWITPFLGNDLRNGFSLGLGIGAGPDLWKLFSPWQKKKLEFKVGDPSKWASIVKQVNLRLEKR